MPGNIGITVQGAQVIRPSVLTTIDASAMVPVRPGPGGPVGFVGPADGGVPGVIYEFSTYLEAARVIRGGPSLSYLARIFAPAPDTNGASKVKFVRIGAPTRSTLTASGITFTSRDYGRHTNGISVKVAAGTGSTWDVTVGKANDGYSKTYNVGKAINVASTGTTPKLVFDHAGKQAKAYENGSVIAYLDYPTEDVTLSNLVSWINGIAGWSATLTGNPSMPVAYMDNPVLGSAPTILAGGTDLPANQGQLVWLVNNDPTCPATAGTLATYDVLSVTAQTLFTGGTGTGYDTFTTNDFQAGLTLLETTTVRHLFLASSTSAVQAAGLVHTLQMRNVTRKRWRIFYTGGPVGETVDQAIARAKALDGPVCYGYNGTLFPNPVSGLVENLGGLGVAAQLCGMAAGTWDSDSATNKGITAMALEYPNISDSDVDKLLIGGVTPVAFDPTTGRATVVQGLTTWQGGSNVAYRKLVGLRVQDNLFYGFQAVLSRFLGAPQDLATGRAIYNDVAKFLDLSVRTPENPGGVLTQGYKDGQVIPAWTNLRVTGDGLESWSIFVETHPVGETAYITVLCKLTPVAISL